MNAPSTLQMMRTLWLAAVSVVSACGAGSEQDGVVRLLNVSYDPTRELYRELNEQFAAQWLAQTGQGVNVQMRSHRRLERRYRDAGAGLGHRQHPKGEPAFAGVVAIAFAE
jgi:sulfate/thiosulfate transport system substrate-binding protein